MPETMDEFMRRMLEAFPNAVVDEDNEGQLIIYTNLTLDREGTVKELELDEDGNVKEE